MFVTQELSLHGQSFSLQRFSLFKFPLMTINGAQIIERRCYRRVLVAKERTPDAEGLLMGAFGIRQVALLPKGQAEIVERGCCFPALRSELFFVKFQRRP